MKTEIFSVNGMKCEHCKTNVENAIKHVLGVEMAEVNLANKSVQVTYNDELTSHIQLKNSVDGLGKFEMIL